MSNSVFRKKSLNRIMKDAIEGVSDGHGDGIKLNKVLTVRDLTFLGIAAVVGAGIFSTIGAAAYDGGPAISILFVITAVTCGFSALCYAEFASRIPIAGSAYTYAYVTFGEIIAWVIGWALILEYAIGNIVVAIAWSGYFNNLLLGFNIHLPGWMLTDPGTAKEIFLSAQTTLAHGGVLDDAGRAAIETWNSAPIIGGAHIIFNLPAFIIVCIISYITYIGITESKRTTNFMVVFKIAVVILVIIVGGFFVKTSNWSPFMPNKFEGVLKGVSAVFYAYIGFDAISTTAEECTNPQRDLPKGMIYSLVICTVLYILVALVLTGMVSYSELKVSDPLAFVFNRVNQKWIGYIISASAVIATTSVLLVFQLGQPRIWMSMSRDKLLPPAFGKIHPKYKTPWFSTIITGIIVAVPTLFLSSGLMTQLTSIGTLFAFVLVSGGVLLLPKIEAGAKGRFHIPYVSGRWIIIVLYAAFLWLFRERLEKVILHLSGSGLQEILFLVFTAMTTALSVATVIRKYSIIPVLGVLFCAYLLIEIPAIAWVWFFVWMGIGLLIYFVYGYQRSVLKSDEPSKILPLQPIKKE
ncbi:MAG: amino acid permease [Bacteroidetes bacterium]|nr:amino acid permease [Bacteroidota bacterium]